MVAALLPSCKKFVEVGPPKTGLTDPSVYASVSTIRSAINGIYADMESGYFGSSFASGGSESVTHVCGLSADELVNYAVSSDDDALYQDAISPLNGSPSQSTWSNPYYYIYQCNSLINGIASSSSVADADKKTFIAEAKFVRAFCYFYLTNLYGDLPLHLATDYRINGTAARSTQADVYAQIINDLKDAEAGMTVPGAGDTRILPNADVASALLARVYLYTNKYADAIAETDKLIGNTSRYQLLNDLNSVFLAESKEAIWQLQPVIPGNNTNEGAFFILNAAPSNVSLTNALVDAFEPNDARRTAWVDSIISSGVTYYYPYKYKVQSSSILTEYSMVMRLAEQYLIRAEAKAMNNDLPGAAADINIIRHRAGLQNTTASSQAALLLAIEQERRVELFTEWGHRWLDLKRTGRAGAVLGPIKALWKPTAVLYPIPQAEINGNNKIVQNAGY